MTQAEKILGWMYLVIHLLFLPAILNALNGLLKDPMGPATLNFVYYCINFVAICCIFATFLKKSFTHAGRSFWDFLQAAVLGFVAYWVCSWLIGHLVQLIHPGFANVNDAAISQMAGNSFWLMAIGVVILVPTVEECLYRGLVFRALHSKSRVAAYLLSMAVFAAIHIIPYVGSSDLLVLLLCFLQYLPAGLCLAWAYEKADSIFAPILIHAVINAMGIYALR